MRNILLDPNKLPLKTQIEITHEPIKCQCCPHIENSQLICTANQLTGFFMRATLAFNGLISMRVSVLSLGDVLIFIACCRVLSYCQHHHDQLGGINMGEGTIIV